MEDQTPVDASLAWTTHEVTHQPRPPPIFSPNPNRESTGTLPPTAKYSNLPEIVRDALLETEIDKAETRHTYITSDVPAGHRRVRVTDTWLRDKHLGSGSFGTVWLEKCVEGSQESQCRAVKGIRKRVTGSVAECRRELEAIFKFSQEKYRHCFVASSGWFDDDEFVFIAMEYFPLGDLEAYLDKPLPESQARQIAHQILEAIAFMHESGFAHRDLKPSNLLVVATKPEWWIKVTDFGIAKDFGTMTLRTVAGTPAYMAPEVMGICPLDETIQRDSYTGAIDIWSLGQICYRILTGDVAFSDMRLVYEYVTHGGEFPAAPLAKQSVTSECTEFVAQTLKASARKRLSYQAGFEHPWIRQQSRSNIIHPYSNGMRKRLTPAYSHNTSRVPNARSALNKQPHVQLTKLYKIQIPLSIPISDDSWSFYATSSPNGRYLVVNCPEKALFKQKPRLRFVIWDFSRQGFDIAGRDVRFKNSRCYTFSDDEKTLALAVDDSLSVFLLGQRKPVWSKGVTSDYMCITGNLLIFRDVFGNRYRFFSLRDGNEAKGMLHLPGRDLLVSASNATGLFIMKISQKLALVGYHLPRDSGMAAETAWRWSQGLQKERTVWEVHGCGLICFCSNASRKAEGPNGDEVVNMHLIKTGTGEHVWGQTISRSEYLDYVLPVPSPDGKLVAVITRATQAKRKSVTLRVFDIKSGNKLVATDIATEWWAMVMYDWKRLIVVHEGHYDVFNFELLMSGIAGKGV